MHHITSVVVILSLSLFLYHIYPSSQHGLYYTHITAHTAVVVAVVVVVIIIVAIVISIASSISTPVMRSRRRRRRRRVNRIIRISIKPAHRFCPFFEHFP